MNLAYPYLSVWTLLARLGDYEDKVQVLCCLWFLEEEEEKHAIVEFIYEMLAK